MDLQTDNLDTDELLHLAIQASQSQRHDQAIVLLKKAVEKSPENANVLYFLAAEHAQIGLYDRAAEEMSRALELNPELHTARFQLGLLYLSSGKVPSAIATLEPLTGLSPDNYFHHFSRGLSHLIEDRFQECKSMLEHGIEMNKSNMALNQDMLKILAAIKDKVEGGEAPAEEQSAGNLWLGAYQKDDGDTQH